MTKSCNKTLDLSGYSYNVEGDHWQDGTTFRPERFVDDDGKVCETYAAETDFLSSLIY